MLTTERLILDRAKESDWLGRHAEKCLVPAGMRPVYALEGDRDAGGRERQRGEHRL